MRTLNFQLVSSISWVSLLSGTFLSPANNKQNIDPQYLEPAFNPNSTRNHSLPILRWGALELGGKIKTMALGSPLEEATAANHRASQSQRSE